MSNTVAQLSSDTKIAISLKKLQGKAHTKTENELYNEGLPSGITMDSSTVFGETPPTNPNTTLGDVTNDVVEKVRLTVTFINGSDTPSGKHGFKLSLPADYESTSSNPKAGTEPFLDNAEIVSSNGLLQLVPPSFDYRYEAVPYYGTTPNLTSIPLADPRDWNLDYFNGVYFQQDPPVNSAEDPTYIDAYLYIGKYLTTVVAEAGGTTTFTSLTDTPSNLTGHAGKVVKVNSSENGLEFDTITLPSNFVGDDGDNTINNEAAGLVPAPAHGDAAAGKYLSADGTWSVPAGGGGGGGASASGVDKYTVRVATQTNALTAIQFVGLNTTDVPANASLSVYLNGDLLLEGTNATVTDFSNQDPRLPSTTNTHYYISSSNELTFGFALVPGDYLVVEKLSFETTSGVSQLNAINGLKQDANTGEVTVEVQYDGNAESIVKKAYDGTEITVDAENDFLIIHDATDDQVKYIKPNQLATGDIESVTAGTGLTGGGTSGDVTLNVADITVSELADATLTTSGESFTDDDTTLMTSAAINDLIESKGYTTEIGDITGVIAGTGLSGGGDTGDVTLNVSNITVSEIHPDTIQLDTESFVSSDSTIMTSAAIDSLITSKGYTTNTGDITAVNAGTGLSGGGTSGDVTIDVDISSLPAIAALDHQDVVAVADIDDSNAVKKISIGDITEFQTGWSNSSAYGIDAFNGRLYLKPSDLGTAPDVDPATDTIIIDDASDSSSLAKKTTISELMNAVGGTGLTPSNGVLNVSDITIAELHADAVQTSGETFSDDDTSVMTSAAINDLIESKGYITTSGDITSVVAGEGLTTGGTSGDVTVDVDYEGDDSVIKSATDGTSITVDTESDFLLLHDATDGVVKYINPDQLGNLGGGGSGGTLGPAEDGSWTDGLFTDFTDNFLVGYAIDRFNEVLKALAPPPAPGVRSIDYSVSGGSVFSGLLSFDATHPDPNGQYVNVETYTQEGQAGFAALSVGDNYTADSITSAANNHDGSDLYFYRVGILTGTQTISGEVNFNVPIEQTANNVVQHTEDAFGDGEVGNLVLEVNGQDVHTMDLTDSNLGSGQPPNGNAGETSLNANGSGFTHVSELRSAYTEGGTEFPSFKHRTARYKIDPSEMQKGFNRARVKHVKGSTISTNYIEWVLDDSSDVIGFSNTTITPTNQQGSTYISGVRYYATLDLDYATDVSNAYKAVHSSNKITTTSSAGNAGTGTNMPTMGATDDMTKEINFTQTIPVVGASDPLLNETVSVSITVPHPIKGSANGGSATTNPILLYNPTANASPTSEDFTKEEYRLQDTTYPSQTVGQASGFYEASKEWDETISLASANATHNTGLQIYNGRLVSPVNSINTTREGDFRNIADGGVLVGYDGNPDYSTEAGNITGVRTYYRWFKNTTNANQRDLRIIYNGSATLTNASDTLDASKIKVSIKLPTSVGGDETGWMDANSQYQMFDHGDGDGGYIGSHTPSISGSVTNYFTFGQKEVLPNEVIIIKIEADTSWTGNLTSLSVQWGASGSGNTAPGALSITAVPLEQVSISGSGTDVNLSFGPSNTIGSYENVSDAGDENPPTSVIDYNGAYDESGNRLGAFVTHLAQGTVNTTRNNRFDRGHLGELKLEVNDVIIAAATIDLTNLTNSGTFADGNGTGFYNVTAATPSVYSSNSLPSYNNIYRSVDVRVQSASQRQGHNYYRVIHTVDGVDSITNYCEWLIDGDNSTFDTSGETMEDWTSTTSVTQSGIKYFSSPESVVKYRVEGAHKNVYSQDNDAIGWRNANRVTVDSWTIVGAGINNATGITSTARALPTLVPNGQLEPMDVTGSISWDGSSKVMPGSLGTNSNQSASIQARIKHPLKLVNGNHWVDTSTMSKSGFLIHPGFTDTSTTTSENFSGENYRILSNTNFSLVANISQGVWDSSIDLSGGTAGYSDGLCQYNGNLVAPANAGSNGDFRNISDGGTFQGPDGNVNYSGLSGNNERVYIRPFYNGTGQSKSRFDITISGVGTITSETQSDNNAGPLNATNFKMFVKIVEPTASPATTGWLDCGEHSNSSVSDNSGCRYGALNNQLPVNIASTNSFEIIMPSGRDLNAAGSNLLLIKIVTNDDWTGRITSLGISL